MFTVILFLFAGVTFGFLMRKIRITFINRIITTFIWCLLFILGLEVGANEKVIKNFTNLGFEAFVLAIFTTFGSLLGAKILWNNIRKASFFKKHTLKNK